MGSDMPVATTVALHARVTATRAQRITWMRNGKPIAETPAPPNSDGTFECDAHPADWFTVGVRDGDMPAVFANAIYVRRR